MSGNYGCSHDIQFNPLESVVMYIDSRKFEAARSMMIGSDQLNFVSNYTYLGHIIFDDLFDKFNMKAKAMQMHTRSNILRQRFHFVLPMLKQVVHHFFLLLHRLPMRCSASGMFAVANVNSCSVVFRKCIII